MACDLAGVDTGRPCSADAVVLGAVAACLSAAACQLTASGVLGASWLTCEDWASELGAYVESQTPSIPCAYLRTCTSVSDMKPRGFPSPGRDEHMSEAQVIRATHLIRVYAMAARLSARRVTR